LPTTVVRQPEPRPAFLRALDHALPAEDGWVAQCPVFGCPDLLVISPDNGHWRFNCDGQHTHDDIVDYLHADTRTDTRSPVRAWVALRLALTPDAWAGLILGLPVQPQAIDQLEHRRLRRAGLWR
jgi:hypothetical protein